MVVMRSVLSRPNDVLFVVAFLEVLETKLSSSCRCLLVTALGYYESSLCLGTVNLFPMLDKVIVFTYDHISVH